MALQIKELDAYNEVFTLSFHQSNVDETMTWDVNTPFSRGAAGEHPADYKWIKFRINSKNSSNFYSSTDFRAYPGNDAVYTGTVSLDTYMTDVANGTDKLLYVDQLVNILQACKERYRTSGSGGSDHLFDSSDYMRFTAFVDEYYYETSPTGSFGNGRERLVEEIRQPAGAGHEHPFESGVQPRSPEHEDQRHLFDPPVLNPDHV